MKFRHNDTIHIILSDDTHMIYIGPIINRLTLSWNFYKIGLDIIINKNTFDILHEKEEVNRQDDCKEYIIKYKDFTKNIKISYVELINDMTYKMTNNDLLDDLDFMKSEIVKCRISMNKFKLLNEIDKYNTYDKMINHEQYKMFQLPSSEDFDKYLDTISSLLDKETIEENEKENMNYISLLSNQIWEE